MPTKRLPSTVRRRPRDWYTPWLYPSPCPLRSNSDRRIVTLPVGAPVARMPFSLSRNVTSSTTRSAPSKRTPAPLRSGDRAPVSVTLRTVRDTPPPGTRRPFATGPGAVIVTPRSPSIVRSCGIARSDAWYVPGAISSRSPKDEARTAPASVR